MSLILAAEVFTYMIFVQAVSDRPASRPPSFDVVPVDSPYRKPIESNEVGGLVSTYTIAYADGSEAHVPIIRRLGIQQSHVCWGASPFAAMPALGPHVHATYDEDFILGRAPRVEYGLAAARNESGRLSGGENLWLYALPNPHPHSQVTGIRLRAENETSLIYAVSTTRLSEHPLRLQGRRKLRMRLPAGINLNTLGELDTDDRGDQIGMDLGTVISARAVLEYSLSDWQSDLHDVQPRRSESDVIVEYSAHPDARLFLRSDDGSLLVRELRSLESSLTSGGYAIEAKAIEPATNPVKISIVEANTGLRVAARLHIHGPHGECLPPRGHHRKVNVGAFQDLYAEYANDLNQYAYVNGSSC